MLYPLSHQAPDVKVILYDLLIISIHYIVIIAIRYFSDNYCDNYYQHSAGVHAVVRWTPWLPVMGVTVDFHRGCVDEDWCTELGCRELTTGGATVLVLVLFCTVYTQDVTF